MTTDKKTPSKKYKLRKFETWVDELSSCPFGEVEGLDGVYFAVEEIRAEGKRQVATLVDVLDCLYLARRAIAECREKAPDGRSYRLVAFPAEDRWEVPEAA